MSELVTTGIWLVKPGEEVAFTEAWTRFATWAATMPGAQTLRLGRDTADASKFISFAPWIDAASVRAWKSQPEFRERIGQVQRHVTGFQPIELDAVATVTPATADATAANAPTAA
jgi:heme-degrading monooxygenase HmoA